VLLSENLVQHAADMEAVRFVLLVVLLKSAVSDVSR
jgi:hypothetical protein